MSIAKKEGSFNLQTLFFLFLVENGYAKKTCTVMRGKSKSATFYSFYFCADQRKDKEVFYETD